MSNDAWGLLLRHVAEFVPPSPCEVCGELVYAGDDGRFACGDCRPLPAADAAAPAAPAATGRLVDAAVVSRPH